MSDALKSQIQEAMKTAMKSGDKSRLATIRLILAAIKQREVDERITLNDEQVLAVLEKMIKQRRDSIAQFQANNRQDLVDKETMEVAVIAAYLPEALSDEAVQSLLQAAIVETGAAGMKDMGKVMALLRPQVQGRTDMAKLADLIKAALQG